MNNMNMNNILDSIEFWKRTEYVLAVVNLTTWFFECIKNECFRSYGRKIISDQPLGWVVPSFDEIKKKNFHNVYPFLTVFNTNTMQKSDWKNIQ
jgi:hypothetical protein